MWRCSLDKGLRVVGETVDGKDVYAGVYYVTHTFGLPLAIVVDQLVKRNGVPDWPALLDEMLEHGMKHSTALLMIQDAMPTDWPIDALMAKLEMAGSAVG